MKTVTLKAAEVRNLKEMIRREISLHQICINMINKHYHKQKHKIPRIVKHKNYLQALSDKLGK